MLPNPAESLQATVDEPAETEAPEVPFLFGCALWVPTFAVVLYVVLRLFGHGSRPTAEQEPG